MVIDAVLSHTGVTFAQCMRQFDEWLKESRWLQESERGRRRDSARSSSFRFATWSDWDLGVMLDEQCMRTEVEKPSYFNQWVDLKHLYQKYYCDNRKVRCKLFEAVANLGLEWHGKEHSALDDCINTMRLLCKMKNDGHPVTITSSIPEQ